MAITKYTYEHSDFLNNKVDLNRLTKEIGDSDIIVSLDHINCSHTDCDIWFKDQLSSEDSTSLDNIVAIHGGEPQEYTTPVDHQGKPLVVAVSRPVGFTTNFTMVGDGSEIGNGKEIYWDFSNDDDIIDSTAEVEVGYKMKRVKVKFADSIYVKEGGIYFHNALKKSYIEFYIVCPAGNYYINRDKSYGYAYTDTKVVGYVRKHFFAGSCPMGDELNTEACTESPIPPNYELWVEISVPEEDNESFGYGSLEIYRERSILLPGEDL